MLVEDKITEIDRQIKLFENNNLEDTVKIMKEAKEDYIKIIKKLEGGNKKNESNN